jgi:hypothetical protein
MKIRIALASGGLLLSVTLLAPVTFAQNPPETSGSATGGTVAAQPPKDAPSAPGSQSPESAENEASGLAAKIEQARKQGKDVSQAELEEKQGEAALRGGYKAEAAQHFNRVKQDLGTM